MQPVQTPDLEAHIDIDAAPGVVYGVVTDVARTPEWSPVVKRSGWVGGATGPAPDARFVGYNRFNGFRWTRECVVTEAEPGARFSFSTLAKDGGEQTRWRYALEPAGDGTRLTLSYEVVSLPRWVALARKMPGGAKTSARQAAQNLDTSLARIKELVEAD